MRRRYMNRDAQPWFLTPAEQADMDSFGPPEELQGTCLIIAIPTTAKRPQPGDAPPTTPRHPSSHEMAADPANPNPLSDAKPGGAAVTGEHWMKELYLNTPPAPRDAAAIRAELMEAEKLTHDPNVVHEEGSWGAVGCPRCDAMQPLTDEMLRSTLRGPDAP